MAVKNPSWKRDELILALDLYFRCNPSRINSSNIEVIQLSEILNKLPIHSEKTDIELFRNPNGVYMKLCNFLRYDPSYKGKALTHGGKLEKEIWNEFSNNRDYLSKVAKSIVAGINYNYGIIDEDEEREYPEGKLLYRQHVYRERNRKLVERAKQNALKNGTLKCVVCGFDFFETYGELGKGFIECHHTIPVCEYSEETITKIEHLALVCSNCHKMLHRKRPWLTINMLTNILKNR